MYNPHYFLYKVVNKRIQILYELYYCKPFIIYESVSKEEHLKLISEVWHLAEIEETEDGADLWLNLQTISHPLYYGKRFLRIPYEYIEGIIKEDMRPTMDTKNKNIYISSDESLIIIGNTLEKSIITLAYIKGKKVTLTKEKDGIIIIDKMEYTTPEIEEEGEEEKPWYMRNS